MWIFWNCLSAVFWCWHFLHQHGTGEADGEGIRPQADAGIDWEAINCVSTWWGNHREGVSSSNLGQAQSHPLSESGCFLSNQSQHRLGIARTKNMPVRLWAFVKIPKPTFSCFHKFTVFSSQRGKKITIVDTYVHSLNKTHRQFLIFFHELASHAGSFYD